MKHFLMFFITTLLFVNFSHSSEGEVAFDNTTAKDFFLVSIPKSGTNLIGKLLTMLSGRNPNGRPDIFQHEDTIPHFKFSEAVLECKQNNEYIRQHLGGRKNILFLHFANTHPEYEKFLQIRDLRDVFVSMVHYYDKICPIFWMEHGLSATASFNDKLTLALTTFDMMTKLGSDIRHTIEWMITKRALVVRFEDLVGPSGGGSLDKQIETITAVANRMNVHLTQEKIQDITDNLFGIETGPSVSTTFYKGQIGSWEDSFTEEHKTLFNTYWGSYQKALGYPLAE